MLQYLSLPGIADYNNVCQIWQMVILRAFLAPLECVIDHAGGLNKKKKKLPSVWSKKFDSIRKPIYMDSHTRGCLPESGIAWEIPSMILP